MPTSPQRGVEPGTSIVLIIRPSALLRPLWGRNRNETGVEAGGIEPARFSVVRVSPSYPWPIDEATIGLDRSTRNRHASQGSVRSHDDEFLGPGVGETGRNFRQIEIGRSDQDQPFGATTKPIDTTSARRRDQS